MLDDSDPMPLDVAAENSKLRHCIYRKAGVVFRLLGSERCLSYLASRTEVGSAMVEAWLAEFRERA